MGSYATHSQFTVGSNPHYAELAFVPAEANVEQFTFAQAAAQSLKDDALGAHIGDDCGIGERLAEGIKTPNLDWKLDGYARAVTSIHDSPKMMVHCQGKKSF